MTALLDGTFVFWCLIARPAFRRAGAAADAEACFDRRLLAVAWMSLLVSIVTGIAWLMGVASNMSGTPLAAVLSQGVAAIVLTQTRFGQVWQLRDIFCVALAFCLLAQRSRWKYVARWIGFVVAAAFVMSLAWAGHGAAADDLPFDFLHLPADLLHLLATSAWLGALVPLGLFLLDGKQAAAVAAQRFSALGITCVGLLIVTGVVNTWFLSGSIPALVGTPYGQLLLLKIALFAVVIAFANVNRSRLVPALGRQAGSEGALYRNTLVEASFGILILGIVGIIGTLPPGLHTEPRWPFPYRLDLGEVAIGAQRLLDVAATLFLLCLAAAALAAERRRYRGMALSLGGLAICGSIAGIAMKPGIVRAYPTTYFASPQAYAASSVARGAPLYAANCAPCHGQGGRGDGPLAKSLSIPPPDLTEEHIFAHSVGDIFWWIGHGKGGVMPGFASTLSDNQRWDLINFVLARAAAVQTKDVGPQITANASAPVPDFAFETRGTQNTLSQTLKNGPVLLVLFARPVPHERLHELTAVDPRLGGAGLRVIAVSLSGAPSDASPPVVAISPDVRATLALFRSPKDGNETELMLDRNGTVRARWTAGHDPDTATLLADAERVARIPVAAANHAGHGG